MTDLAIKTSMALANFGERDEIKELAVRISSMLPGGQHYTEPEARTLAQIAVAHDLDPFNGEVWLIKDEDKGKVYGALIGIKGLRKHAKKQANYWGFGGDGGFTRVTDPNKLAEYGAKPGDIVFEYRLMDEVTAKSHVEMAERYYKMGVPLEQIYRMIGQPPITLGVGIWQNGEHTKMKPAQCAMYRAEKDAIKRRFDVKFRVEINGQSFEAGATDIDNEPNTDEIEAEYEAVMDEPHDPNELLAEMGFDAPPEPELPAQPKSEMSYETACTLGNSRGQLYKDLDDPALISIKRNLETSLKGELTDDKREAYQMKSDAITVILAHRKNGQPA